MSEYKKRSQQYRQQQLQEKDKTRGINEYIQQINQYQQQQQQHNNNNIGQQQYDDDDQQQQYCQDSPSMQLVISTQQNQQIRFDHIIGGQMINGQYQNRNDSNNDGRFSANGQKQSKNMNNNNNRNANRFVGDGLVMSFGNIKGEQNQGQHTKILVKSKKSLPLSSQIQITISSSLAQQQQNQQKQSITNNNNKNNNIISFSNLQSQSQQKLYQQYQHDDNASDSSDSQSSLDSQASFTKMNARRTMLLSDDFYGNNHYSAIIDQLSQQQCKVVQQTSKKIAHLQSLIKRQSILLQFEQKTKNQRVKEIQYSYVNAFNNFLFLRNVKHHSTQTNPILLNSKDLFQIHEEFLDDLRRIKEAIGKVVFASCNQTDGNMNFQGEFLKTISSAKYIKPNNDTETSLTNQSTIKCVFSNGLHPPQSFLMDFHNFFPCWSSNIYQFMQMQFDSHQKIQNTFESQYTIPSKILSSIKYKDNVRRFCQIIFKKPIQELKKVKTQLIIDFSNIYQRWTTTLFNIPNSNPLKQFMQGRYLLQEGTTRNAIVQEIGKFFGEKMDPSEYEKLLIQLNHFAKNKNAMNFLFSEIGRQQIQGQQINLRLALLVHKKMQINRRKLQQLSLLFINQIIDNYEDIPVQIKYIIQVFKQLAKKKLQAEGQQPVVKYEDLKSFFNKIIFSQLFFTIFLQLLDDEQHQTPNKSSSSKHQIKSFASGHQSHNITMIALISQKIMFGQEFYQKFKYGYFNTVIKEYNTKIKSFIENFAQTQVIKFEGRKQIECMLVSLQTVKFLYEALKKKGLVRQLVSFQKKLMSCKHNEPFALGSSRYTQQKMYLMIVYKPQFNYSSIFRPKQKFRRTFIEFLTMIESINDGVTFRQVLEQYKCMEEDNLQIAKPSIQIYANYLSSFQKNIQTQNIVQEIQEDIAKTKLYIEKVKISLERQHNISMNMEHLYRSLLMEKKKSISKQNLEDYINLLFNLPLQFDYFVMDGKICENENTTGKKKQRVIKDCLNDVAAFFGKGLQGLDGLYSLLLEKIVDEIEKQGVVDENMIENAQIILGEKLYKMINLSVLQSQKDKKLFNSMKRHRFLNLKMLTLPQYIDEEQIILQMSLQILQRLKHPMSPDKMIECFNEVTLVFQNVITCVGKASDITSDVQIPLMQLILVKSMIPNLNTMLQFIKTFSHNENGSNKYGMILALVQSICYLIQNMDAQHLGISESEYVGYIENEYIIVDEKY